MELRISMDATIPLPKDARGHAQTLEAALAKHDEILKVIEALGGYCHMHSRIVQGRKRKATLPLLDGLAKPPLKPDDLLELPPYLKGLGAS